ncbi:MAG: tail protein X [Deltaproteobacteria bacterium]|nr:tail protein X [Deltaproteobacteria bacterium]
MAATETYTTIQGDTWDWIAKKIWGGRRESMLHHLVLANPDHRHLRFFPAGVVLVVPAVTPPREEAPPPWQIR